jgi:hypothetical protein
MSTVKVATREGKPAVISAGLPMGGLCRDCVKADTCTFPRDPSRPVWSCEEFEGVEPNPPHPTARAGVAVERVVVVENPAETRELTGLCRECARRPGCRYPKPLGGVWHCDELA